MLGYNKDVSCASYPTTLPGVLKNNGYRALAVGKDHFGFNETGDGRAILHGYDEGRIYDAENGAKNNDDYQQFWFSKHGDEPPVKSDTPDYLIDYNTWRATDYVYDEADHPTTWTADRAIDYVDQFDFSSSASESLFLKVSFHRPHSPYDPPKRLHDKYKADLSKLPARHLAGTWDEENKNTTEMFDDAWFGNPGEAEARKSRAGYFASIEFVDEQIGRIVDRLKYKGVYDDMFVIWSSDHGDMMGDHYLWRKGFPYESSTHIPLVVKWPRSSSGVFSVGEGAVIDALVEVRDIAPTLWDIAGSDVLQKVKTQDPLVTGMSLLPLLRGEETKVRDLLDLEENWTFQPRFHWNAIIDNDTNMKYVFNAHTGYEQIFNLTADPFELNDAIGSDGELLVWRRRLISQFKREKRGSLFLNSSDDDDDDNDDDALVFPRKPLLFSKNYPCYDGYVPVYVPH